MFSFHFPQSWGGSKVTNLFRRPTMKKKLFHMRLKRIPSNMCAKRICLQFTISSGFEPGLEGTEINKV